MFEYIYGQVTEIAKDYIIIDNNNIGYLIYTKNKFKLNQKEKVFVYQHIKEDSNSLYGFTSKEEKIFFTKLISVKGLGVKTAIMLIGEDINEIKKYIENKDIDNLKKFNKIGEKLARQIILDLKGKLTEMNIVDNELSIVLKNLGFKDKEVIEVINKVDFNLRLEEQIKEALKLLSGSGG